VVAEIRITGAQQLKALGIEMRAAGEEGKGLRRELLKSMRVAGAPLIGAAKRSAQDVLPKKGGLNNFIASSNIGVANKLTGNRAGTRIVAKKPGGKKGHDLAAFDDGQFRHPVYGKRDKDEAGRHVVVSKGGGKAPWVQESCTPGWFTKPMLESAPALRAALLAAMTITERKITKG
jgi:hypothetical protein